MNPNTKKLMGLVMGAGSLAAYMGVRKQWKEGTSESEAPEKAPPFENTKNTLVPKEEGQQAASTMNEQRPKTVTKLVYSGWAFPDWKFVKVTEFKESSDDTKKK